MTHYERICKISETTIPTPNTPYCKWKLHFYNDAFELCRKHEVTLIEPRFFSICGPMIMKTH